MKTVDELIEFIASSSRPGDWMLRDGYKVRHFRGGDVGPIAFCPVCWVADAMGCRLDSGLDYTSAAYRIGVPYAVAQAADKATYSPEYDPALRAKLLAACHLKETVREDC